MFYQVIKKFDQNKEVNIKEKMDKKFFEKKVKFKR